jgi:hypothetical protein
MNFEASTLDLHTQELLQEVLDEIRREIAGSFDEAIIGSATVDGVIASALMSAAATGSRDRAMLKRYALHVVARTIRKARPRK